MLFPPRAVRGVRVHYARPSCQGGTADVSVDFEPLPDGAPGFEFVDAVDWSRSADDAVPPEELRDCADAVGEGVLLTLSGVPWTEMVLSAPGTVRGHRFRFPPGDADAPGTFAHALARGVPLLGEADRPLIATRVVLRRARHSIIDSFPGVFRRAGHQAARKAISRTDGLPFTLAPGDRA
ncbi:hypothetical protein HDA32_006001 [Spinactinospora alkalitolerans]|uniref:Uncharacterized protein n=1 Tax=Spinactinospora alkalitolerans TaxID=687207 RepID=A0A852U3W1_9ACTN|nr:hypothetical protein [Spinactinospora alkalitolerans]NYE50881.1 hypothetical protein [Spinactinospora alkalitolerans]